MLRRVLLVLVLLATTLVLLAGGASVWLVKRAEPRYSGEVTVPGLVAPVEILYGPHGVPSIVASSPADLVFAQGYTVAGERMWQMDLMRRLGDGRLAEVFGPGALGLDRLFRTLGLGSDARRSLAELEAPYRELLSAHAAGVNAYLRDAAGRLPIEFRIAGFDPDPWRPEDSLIVGAYLSWTQSFNLRQELAYLPLAARVGPERARELFPVDAGVPAPPPPELPADVLAPVQPAGEPAAAPVTGPERGPAAGAGQAGTPELAARLLALLETPAALGLPAPGAASNAWAVTGRRTADGQAMLANDPHLAPGMPGVWYELEIRAPGLHAAGLALPGVPLILIGHNEDLGWGFTSAIADTQDLFLERPSADGRAVERPGGASEPIESRLEHIPVKGVGTVPLAVGRTSLGQILNACLEGPAPGRDSMALPRLASPYLLTLRQANDLPDRGFPALLGLNRASTLEEARAAVLGFRQVSQNLLVAHRNGGIAWQVSGLLPRRTRGTGTYPAPGWEAGWGWDGFEPQSANPGRTDPAGAALIAANNRTVPLDYPVHVASAWMAPYRAERIAERLAEAPPLSPGDMVAIQSDRLSIQARLTQQAVRRLEPGLRAADPQAWAIAENWLLPWDSVMDGASRPGALFALIEPALYRELYGDELGDDLPVLSALAIAAYNPVQEVIRSGQSSFWDDRSTPEVEGQAEIWGRALRRAKSELDRRLPRPKHRRLDRLQTLVFPHAFHPLPGLGWLFDVGPVGLGGGPGTIDVAKPDPWDPGEIRFAPSARLVQTPADWSATRGTLPLGQSGHRLSPYRKDQLADWLAGRTHPWPWNGPPQGRVEGTLTLSPAAAAPPQSQ
jgi:acyl-homoserine lactone acylase PvdQ